MVISEEVETMQEYLVELTDDLVDESVTPEDMYFTLQVLEEYYNAIAPREFGSVTAAEIAWALAKDVASAVEHTEDFDWFNAYFVVNGLFEASRAPAHDGSDWNYDVTDPVEHPESLSYELPNRRYDEGAELFDDLEDAQADILEILQLYVDLHKEDEDEALTKPQEVSMFLSILQKRYAHYFPDDMLESTVSFNFVGTLTALEKDEEITKAEVVDAVRIVKKWAELRAHREHEMLCVGTA